MDDLRRAIWMEVREQIVNTAEPRIFVCEILWDVAYTRLGIPLRQVEDFFPEFFQLWDGYLLTYSGRLQYSGDESGANKPWWPCNEEGRRCRLAAIDYILSR